jgi:hypothetical protein
MRIEGIGDSSGTGTPNRAFEQARAHRLAIRPTAAVAAPDQAAPTTPKLVQDVHDRPPPSSRRMEVMTSAAEAMQTAAGPRTPPPPLEPPTMDTDGDGWIDVNDLPFDYFQIVRQTHIKLRTESPERVEAPTAPAAGATATRTAPATGRLSALPAAATYTT